MISKIKSLQKQVMHVDDFVEILYSVFNECERMYRFKDNDTKIMTFKIPEKDNVVCLICLTVLEYEFVRVDRVSLVHRELLEKQIKNYI